ncbi:cyclin-dependent kinase inhibitor domain-containing protein [Ditylenchus destructor]|nr:cyclin-dependent kinase inhibitor domain-containing protein [Ditylenchus destructor]
MQVLTCQPHSNSDSVAQSWANSPMASSQSIENSRPFPVSSPARRCLFGQPQPGEESNDQFVKRLLEELHDNYKKKWDFDFVAGQPLHDAKDAKFEYTPIPSDQVPGFYRASSYAKHSYKVHPHYLQPGRYIEEEEDFENMDPSSHHNGSAGQSSSSSTLLHDSTSSSSTSFLSESSLIEKDEDGELQPMDLVEECIIQSGSGEFEDEKEPITKSPRKLLRASSGRKKAAITPKKAQSKLSDFMPYRRKNLQRSAKKSDLKTEFVSPRNPCSPPTKIGSAFAKAVPTRSSVELGATKVARRRSTVGARLAAAAALKKQA